MSEIPNTSQKVDYRPPKKRTTIIKKSEILMDDNLRFDYLRLRYRRNNIRKQALNQFFFEIIFENYIRTNFYVKHKNYFRKC